jgi:hypothetical protein
MPFTNYPELQAAVADWLDRPDLEAQIKDFIRLAEIRVQRTLKMRVVESKTSGTNMVADQEYIVLPTDCVEPYYLRIDTSPIREVEIVSLDKLATVKQNKAGLGYPIAGAVHGVNMELAPAPGDTHAYTLYYLAGVTALTDAAPTNTLLTNYPDLLLYGALVVAGPFVGTDERVKDWLGLWTEAATGAKRQDARAKAGGGPLRMRPDVVV